MSTLRWILRNFFSLSGRMRRSDFWICTLVLWGINLTAFIAATAYITLKAANLGIPGTPTREQALEINRLGLQIVWAFAGLGLVTLWPNLAVNAKRLHDRGRSAGINLVFYLPLIFVFTPYPGGYLLWAGVFGVTAYWLIELGLLDGKPENNRYGPSPKLVSPGRLDEVFA